MRLSETGRIRFRRVWFQTQSSVSFSGLTEFRGASSVSSSLPIIYAPKQTHRVSRRTHRVCRRTQWVLSSEPVLSKQYSARFLGTETDVRTGKIAQAPFYPSEKPRIRLEYTVMSASRSAFSKAPRKLLHVDFARKERGHRTSWSRSGGGPTVLKEHYLNSTLGVA